MDPGAQTRPFIDITMKHRIPKKIPRSRRRTIERWPHRNPPGDEVVSLARCYGDREGPWTSWSRREHGETLEPLTPTRFLYMYYKESHFYPSIYQTPGGRSRRSLVPRRLLVTGSVCDRVRSVVWWQIWLRAPSPKVIVDSAGWSRD